MSILSILFPNRCPYCDKLIDMNETECSVCRGKFPDVPHIRKLAQGNVCVSPFVYDGTVRDAIRSLKFRNCVFNAKSLSGQMCRILQKLYGDEDIDIVTAVPMSRSSKRERGYNQAELLAKETAKLLGKPYEELLKKVKKNLVQHELNGEDRKRNVIGVYAVTDKRLITDKRILLVDDICTTGSTLSECCKVLLECSPADIICTCAAETSAD